MLEINTWRNPYNAGFSTTRPRKVIIEKGLTTLVGCNGAGKTTLLMNIREQCKKENIPFMDYDSLKEGGSQAFESCIVGEDFGLANALYSSSEGEAVKLSFGNMLTKAREFLKTGFYNTLHNRIFSSMDERKEMTDRRRVFLFDAIDSGLSIDSVAEVRNIFDLILKDGKALGIDVYIIVSANAYEMARNAPCFDVAAGKYVKLEDYETYRSFIMKSRERKEKRNQRTKKAE